MLRISLIACVFLLHLYCAFSQDHHVPFTQVNLDNKDAFMPGATNWNVAGDIFYDLKENGKTKIINGSGVLVNNLSGTEKAHLLTTMEHGDIEIELDFMMDKNSNSGIYLQSRYEIQLFDSWGVQTPRALDCGAIYERWDEKRPEGRKGFEGHPPAQNVSKAPGLWQHLEISFKAPRFNTNGVKITNARFVKVILNGVTIHENVEVTGPTRASYFQDEKVLGPLMIQGDHGAVAIRNIRYKAYGTDAVKLSGLQLKAYEGKFNTLPDFDTLTPAKEMRINTLEHTGTESTNHFAGKITGTLLIPKSGPYHFVLNLKWIPTDIDPEKPNGGGQLRIGDKTIFNIDGSKSGVQSTAVTLEAGDYPFELSYFKGHKLWYVPTDDILLGVEAPGIQYTNLNASFKAVEAVGAIRVAVHDEPVMLRSFVNHNGRKRTHVISVGEKGNINYSVDLGSGSLLQFWKGEFAETTLMWDGRGEPQLAVPLGSIVQVSGKPSVAFLQNNNDAWPDSSAQYDYHGYDVNPQGRPVFKYSLGKSSVKDLFESSGDGKKLTHTISVLPEAGRKQVWFLLAEGNNITRMPNGLYAINKEYFIEIPGKQEAVLRKTPGNLAQLVMPVTIKENLGRISYSIIW